MRATLYGVPASHPSLAAELMLEAKGVDARRVDLVTAVHRVLVRALGFPRATVPAVRLDGARVQGTASIARALDALVPEPPLVPADPQRRAAVEAAESWGDEVLQPVARRLIWAALTRDRSEIASYLRDQRTGLPTSVAAATGAPIAHLAARLNRVSDESARADLAALPRLVERVDALIADGTLGGPTLNVADYQIGTSTSLMLTLDDLRPFIEGRPAAEHARRVVPDQAGHTPSVFPKEWLPQG